MAYSEGELEADELCLCGFFGFVFFFGFGSLLFVCCCVGFFLVFFCFFWFGCFLADKLGW
jgi:hypothetical protein